MDEYDISDIFKDMEEYLISSMSRNLGKHTAWEDKEGFKWDTWQSKQLEALAEFRKNNGTYVKGQTKEIKSRLSKLIKQSNEHGQLEEEIKILNAIKNGYKGRKVEKGLESTFLKINDRKLKALIKATNSDLEKATIAALRMTNDQYRQTIYKAQMFANTGTMTVNQAIDMATKDFLSRGINCIEYSNGRRVGIDTYSEMAIRNANKKAYLQGEGVKRQEYGIVTVLVSRYGACSETCLPYQGKVYIDDVWSGGTAEDGERLGYPLLSTAIAGGLFHPNCKHSLSTYFEGLTTIPTAREVAKTRENSDLVAAQRYNEINIRKYKRLENNSLDEENKAYYGRYKNKWLARQKELLNSHPEMNRNRAREKVRVNDTFDRFGISQPYSLEERKAHNFGNNNNARNMKINREAIILKNNEGVEFIYPKDYDKSKQIIQPRDAITIFESIPKKLQNVVKNIEFLDCFNPDDDFCGKEYGIQNFVSFANGGNKKITFWQNGDMNIKKMPAIIKRTYCHEAAHNLDSNRIISNSKEWKMTIQMDGKSYPTEYAKYSPVEDLAESIAEVAINPEIMKSKFPNRYKFIRKILEDK